MTQDDNRDSGIPTRTIHDGYLQLQQAHRQFRQIRDAGGDVRAQQGALQDAVLTFFELVRPHLKHESALEDYWTGALPDYAGWDFDSAAEAAEYVEEKGTGVYQVQQHVTGVEIDEPAIADGGLETLEAWHDYLGLSWDTERVVAVQPADGGAYVKLLRAAVLALRELDHWQVRIVQERTRGDGFMASETSTETRREYQPVEKLVCAKRQLVEAADRLGALSEFDASTTHTEITQEDIKRVEEWRQEALDQ